MINYPTTPWLHKSTNGFECHNKEAKHHMLAGPHDQDVVEPSMDNNLLKHII